MLDLEIVPEISLGCESWEFILGMHFSQAVAIIQSQVGIIKGVQVLYSDTNPLGVDIVINLPQDGIRLIFDPVVQRLKIIEVFNMKLVKLRYSDVTFNSPEVVPSIEQIEHSFGATHPGVYDAAKQLFALHFRGLSFFFPVDSKLHPGYAHGLGSLIFPSGASPVVSKMSIYSGGNNMQEIRAPPLPFSCYNRQIYLESASVLRNSNGTRGLKLQLFTDGSLRALEPRRQTFTREILFGDTCQDVSTNLGSPNKIFFKSEDKMKIHSPSAHRRAQTKRSDIFFNYFTLGIDVLFDAITQRCKKIILHTNYPGHYNFNMYHRCEFQLNCTASDKTNQEPLNSPVIISAYSKWDTISTRLTPSERPVVLHRASSTNTANPFGSTFCYGYQDIIFEVMPNNYIASVTLYNTASYCKKTPNLWQNKGLQDIRLNV
ncbi:PHAF1 protein CG7083 [Condylostylus longicornis]|uniref:PHAF1 protein CG7083 n=1 Tax=Condylostylus longicornis TaxID=2530218 RepID=UPI00244DF0FD|nr:PHAF1 protein CG7083 [Condylostylus longicornis]XP_055374331.1 PHAF1 protein CG7083 [Condylostylus longicornis]